MPFQHLLAAYDGSEQSKMALDKAVDLVRSTPGSRLSVVHVYHFPSLVVGEAMIAAPVSGELDGMSEAERLLEEAKARAASLPNTTTALLQGDTALAVLDYAEKHGADLIVIGSRGLGRLGELFLGSVSHYVVQHAKVPVLVIKRE
ncbi:universal stress protein [Paenibacillus flagellatus]|uniref:Universal stress protein UspA n=1 Tax=Paenibacillus flagellatus TaxID=2211139 RepID=A0A2V5KM82_9BACL|nr:universal stress protein [Paenibacillus flagellatus]PYI56210.1 universal stress protein UspA [Paenibacillus flagellatus]